MKGEQIKVFRLHLCTSRARHMSTSSRVNTTLKVANALDTAATIFDKPVNVLRSSSQHISVPQWVAKCLFDTGSPHEASSLHNLHNLHLLQTL